MKLSVVVVNYNTRSLLEGCLDTLAALDCPFETEVVVVDNGSTDGSREWLASPRETADQIVLSDQNVGFAAGCNLALQRAGGEYLLLLNTDAFPEPGALEILVAYLDAHPGVGIVGPQLVYPGGRWQRSGGRVPSPVTSALHALGVTSAGHVLAAAAWRLAGRWWWPRPIGYVDGASLMVRRAVIEEIGSLSERFFFFLEDAEFCLRARRNGWKVRLVPRSRVVHLRGKSSSQKDFRRAVQMRVAAEAQFVRDAYGEAGWRRYRRWMCLNHRWRLALCQLLHRSDSACNRYQLTWEAYRQSSKKPTTQTTTL